MEHFNLKLHLNLKTFSIKNNSFQLKAINNYDNNNNDNNSSALKNKFISC